VFTPRRPQQTVKLCLCRVRVVAVVLLARDHDAFTSVPGCLSRTLASTLKNVNLN
jgi:hypothetical protein